MLEEPFRYHENNRPLFWDTWKLYQRFVVVVFAIFFINPIERMCYLLPLMLLLLVVHLIVKPYKNEMVNWLETASLFGLCFLVGVNMLRAVVYVYAIPDEAPLDMILFIFNKMEFFCNPPVTLIFICTANFFLNIFIKSRPKDMIS